jgi:hypothetical protein
MPVQVVGPPDPCFGKKQRSATFAFHRPHHECAGMHIRNTCRASAETLTRLVDMVVPATCMTFPTTSILAAPDRSKRGLLRVSPRQAARTCQAKPRKRAVHRSAPTANQHGQPKFTTPTNRRRSPRPGPTRHSAANRSPPHCRRSRCAEARLNRPVACTEDSATDSVAHAEARTPVAASHGGLRTVLGGTVRRARLDTPPNPVASIITLSGHG